MKVIWSLVVTIIIVCCVFSLPSNSYITHSILVKNQILNKLNINRRNYNNYRNHVIQLSSSSSSSTTTTDGDIDMSDSLLEILNEEPAIVASDVTTIIPEITKFPTKISDAKEELNYQPQGTSYCICSQCKTAYLIDITILSSKGLRVQCNVCDKDWFQTPERLMRTDEYHVITKMNDDKVLQVKKIIAEKNFPKYPRVDKVGVFIGNLPYTYTEKEIGDLFGEYGLTNIALVKDAEQQSKGYGFLECSSLIDAQRLVNEMHHFYTEPNRKLTCRLANDGGPSTKGSGERTFTRDSGTAVRPGGGGGGYNGGGGGARTFAPSRPSNNGGGGVPIKSWNRRNDN